MEQLIAKIIEATGLDENLAKQGLSVLVNFLNGEAGGDVMQKVFAAVPGLDSLVDSGSGDTGGGMLGGLMGGGDSGGGALGGLMGSVGGLGGGLDLAGKMSEQGVGSEQAAGLVGSVVDHLKSEGGDGLVGEVVDAVPMLKSILS